MSIRLATLAAALGLALAGATAGTPSADTVTKIVRTHTPGATKVVKITRHVPHRWHAHVVRVFHPLKRVAVVKTFGPHVVTTRKIVRIGHHHPHVALRQVKTVVVR